MSFTTQQDSIPIYDTSAVWKARVVNTRHLIRHGPKAWSNGRKRGASGKSHDPPLATKGPAEVEAFREELLLRSPRPDVIICSPFLRCRETAKILSEGNESLIKIEPRLREMLGNWSKRQHLIQLEPETWEAIKGQRLCESWSAFNSRIEEMANELCKLPANQNIWVVCHGVVIQELSKRMPAFCSEVHLFESDCDK